MKKLGEFSFDQIIANIEAFLWNLILNTNRLFCRCDSHRVRWYTGICVDSLLRGFVVSTIILPLYIRISSSHGISQVELLKACDSWA